MKIGRNDLCPCGSGLKYKRCHDGIVGAVEQTGPQTVEPQVAMRLATDLLSTGQNLQAISLCESIPHTDKGFVHSIKVQVKAHWALGDVERARNLALKAYELTPSDLEVIQHCCSLELACQNLTNAERFARLALQSAPSVAANHNIMGMILRQQKRDAESVKHFRQATHLDSKDARLMSNLSAALDSTGDALGAQKCLRSALALDPKLSDVRFTLGLLDDRIGDDEAALVHWEYLLQQGFRTVTVLNNAANSLFKMGRLNEAVLKFDQARCLNEEHANQAFSGYLFALTQKPGISHSLLISEHFEFGLRYDKFVRLHPFFNERTHLRPLRIGFVSPDLRDHAVSRFVEPVISSLCQDIEGMRVVCFASGRADNVTKRIQSFVLEWHDVDTLTDEELAAEIERCCIDILIDLSGHTAYNRLLTFARKPAPIQVSWMGYPGTTGLQAMDYYFTDTNFAPPGLLDDQFTEKLVRLPASAPFRPVEGAPPINVLPALTDGCLTLGSFNAASKISRPVVALWARLLHALPNVRMVLGAMPNDGQGALTAQWFAEEGIDNKRLQFIGRRNITDYMALHHQIDICLDTFPYNGGTTTMYAVWMGVPTLTLAGNTLACRTGTCIMGGLSLPDFVANSEDDFVAKGVMWAGRLQELSDLRATMRERFNASALGRPELIAAGAAHAFRTMWQRWCNGLEPESFEVTIDDCQLNAASLNSP